MVAGELRRFLLRAADARASLRHFRPWRGAHHPCRRRFFLGGRGFQRKFEQQKNKNSVFSLSHILSLFTPRPPLQKKNASLPQEALSVDFALVGAEAVVESGGAVSKLGTYGVAVAAKAASVPFYVAAESYKFSRLYPLGQKGLPEERKHVDFGPLLPRAVRVNNPSRDYTPPKFISLLFTDLGVLTPAAVSDELIQLYT